MKPGLLMHLREDAYEVIAHAAGLGFDNGQLVVWDMNLYREDIAQELERACRDFQFTLTAIWTGWSGPVVWSYPEMYETLGLVPPQYREQRTQDLLNGAAFARRLGVKDIITHMGFLPDNPNDPNNKGVVEAIRKVSQTIAPYGQRFLFETGEELPNSLVQLFREVGTDNIGINFDPANLLINARANPLDAMDRLAPFVMGCHAKDGVYPQGMDPKGKEVQIGQGGVDFEKLFRKLFAAGYEGPITIEREIPLGAERDQQLVEEKAYLENILEKLGRL